MSMNNAPGLETIASGRDQQGTALSPMRVASQKAVWAGGLTAAPPSGTANSPVSFQALLAAEAAEESSSPRFGIDDLATDQPEVDVHSKGAWDNSQSKSNLTTSGKPGSHIQSETKTAQTAATVATPHGESQPSMTVPSFLPAQPARPVRTKIESPESAATAAPAGTQVSRSKGRSNVSSEIESKAPDLPKSTTPAIPAMRDGRYSLISPAAEPSEVRSSSLRMAAPATVDIPGGNRISGVRAATREERGGSSLMTTNATPRSGRISPPADSPDDSDIHFEEHGPRADALSDSERDPGQELASGLENVGNGVLVHGKRPSEPTDRPTQIAPSLRTAPSGSAHKTLSLAAALPETVSSESVQSKRAMVATPQASKMIPAVLPLPDKAMATVGPSGSRFLGSSQALHMQQSSHSAIAPTPASPGFSREPSSMLSMSHTASVTTSDASSSRIGPARLNAQDTFAALDEQNPPGAPVWIHTGGNKAEAGFKDPTLGWIGVRAQVDAGGVHASVVTASALASQALSSNMTNLSAYLDEQHTPVQSLTMATSESSWEGRNTDNPSSTNAGQGNAQEGNSGQQQASSNSVASAATVAQDRFIQTTDPIESSLAYLATGAKYISVIA